MDYHTILDLVIANFAIILVIFKAVWGFAHDHGYIKATSEEAQKQLRESKILEWAERAYIAVEQVASSTGWKGADKMAKAVEYILVFATAVGHDLTPEEIESAKLSLEALAGQENKKKA